MRMTLSATAVTLLWQRQNIWSQSADRLKARITRSRVAALLLIMAGAVLGTASSQVLDQQTTVGRVLAACAAVVLALASFASLGSSPQVVRDWTRARSVSEGIKADVYCYLAGVTPFHNEDRDRVALERLDALTADTADIVKHTTGTDSVDRPLPRVRDVDTYAEVRVAHQITGYYRPKAREMARRVRFARLLEVTVSAVGAALAAAVVVFPSASTSAWIGILTTLATAVAAHAGAARYEYQQIEFTRTADELERLATHRAATGASQMGDDQFVLACERVISIQNEGWMAKLSATDQE
ncbi:hypothetical protein ALI144C_31750 [Actinosynnema sp. ALI-1.44]|nr:hypothetical protein ALI144C_31750 [Actinosynnema sp. ALI-1.44]